MDEHEVAWPTGMSDHDPAARERPLVFNPQGFLHIRHYGHGTLQDIHIR